MKTLFRTLFVVVFVALVACTPEHQKALEDLRNLKVDIEVNHEIFTGEDWSAAADRLVKCYEQIEINQDKYTKAELEEIESLYLDIITGPGGADISSQLIGKAWDDLMDVKIGDIFGSDSNDEE